MIKVQPYSFAVDYLPWFKRKTIPSLGEITILGSISVQELLPEVKGFDWRKVEESQGWVNSDGWRLDMGW